MVSRLGFSTSCCQFSRVRTRGFLKILERSTTDLDVILEDDWMKNFVVLGPSVVFLFVRRRESRNFCTSSASRPRFDEGHIRFLPCPKMAPRQICGEANEESEDDEEDEVGFICPYYLLLPLLPLLPLLLVNMSLIEAFSKIMSKALIAVLDFFPG